MAKQKIVVFIGAFRAAEFNTLYTRDAHDFARRRSRECRTAELHLVGGQGAGIIGQYESGRVTPEFKAHNRAAGLRTKVGE